MMDGVSTATTTAFWEFPPPTKQTTLMNEQKEEKPEADSFLSLKATMPHHHDLSNDSKHSHDNHDSISHDSMTVPPTGSFKARILSWNVGHHRGSQVLKSLASLLIEDHSFCGRGKGPLVTMLQEHNSTILGISLGLSHPLLKQVEYWLQTNRCGRSKLCRDTATKEDLAEILETASNVKMRQLAEQDTGFCNNKIGLVYALLRTNPALWSR